MHTMWKGSISFGLVNIPIKMFAATENKDLRFRQLHKECNTPVKYKKFCEHCGREVKEDEIVKAFEYEKDRFVIMKEEDFKAAKAEVLERAIDIVDFVNLNQIDPVFFGKTYYLSPERGGKAYNLLRKAMSDTGRIALAKITIRNKQSLAALRVFQNALMLETLFYPDEIRDIGQVPGLPQNVAADPRELEMAVQLIDQLTTNFNPEKYQDEYRKSLHQIIQNKIQGKAVDVKVQPQVANNVVDLMSALQASLKENKKANRRTGSR